MLLKRMLLKAATITLMSFSAVAFAAPDVLHTENFTDDESTVFVTSSTAPSCAATFGSYTPKRNADGSPGVSNTKWFQVKVLCMGSKDGICKAKVYMNKNCSGDHAAETELNLGSGEVTVTKILDPKYNVTAKGPNVKLAYADGK